VIHCHTTQHWTTFIW